LQSRALYLYRRPLQGLVVAGNRIENSWGVSFEEDNIVPVSNERNQLGHEDHCGPQNISTQVTPWIEHDVASRKNAPAWDCRSIKRGRINGILVALFRLPPLAVTLETMDAFRGLAFIIGSDNGYIEFDDSYLFTGSEQLFHLFPYH
jgi:hypothetical protein